MKFLLLVFLLVSCTSEDPTKKADTGFFKQLAKTPSVTVMSIAPREIPLVIKTSGKTIAADRFEAKAPSRMRVAKVFVEEGANVQAGDNILRFDYEEVRLRLAKAKAELKEGEAGVEQETFVERNKEKLIEQGKITELEGELAEKKLTLYQAILERARVELELYEKTGDWTEMSTPIPGIVLKKYVSDGALLEESQPLVDIVRLDPMKFVFMVPVEYAAALSKEAEVSIRLPAFPQQEFKGERIQVAADIQASGGGVEVKVDLANPDLQLKTDLRGDVVIRTKDKKKIFPLPETALLKTDKSVFVFKIDGDKVKKIPVELGSEPYANQPVVEKGIGPGDRIVVSSVQGLKDGMSVTIETEPAK